MLEKLLESRDKVITERKEMDNDNGERDRGIQGAAPSILLTMRSRTVTVESRVASIAHHLIPPFILFDTHALLPQSV